MTDEITPIVPVQTANQPIDLTPAVNAVDVAVTDVRKDAENEAKQHINTIWQNIEIWTHEKLEELIADLKKYTSPSPTETPAPTPDAAPAAEVTPAV